MPEFPVFRGNCPRNVSKDAKYSVRGQEVGLMYETAEDEVWRVTTDSHPELVTMVNNVKTSLGSLKGAFYINEYKQVIVPVPGSRNYYLAGEYEKPLRFNFEDKIISGEPIDLDGNPISPGEQWVGPHPGVSYVLKAGGGDIYYTSEPRPNVETKNRLSKLIGPEATNEVCALIREHKGFDGGRFYVNEFRSIFTPIKEGYDWQYIYVGELDLDKWFPKIEIT